MFLMRLHIIVSGSPDATTHFKVHLLFSAPFYNLFHQKIEKPAWYLAKRRFVALHANISCDNTLLAHTLSQQVRAAWEVGSFLIEDETVFEWTGNSPVKVYIPRKPHPNGLLAYGQCTWTLIQGTCH